MSSRLDQVNSLIRKELAEIISRDVPMNDSLITISYVSCAPDLRDANIGISVLPESMSASSLKALRSNSRIIMEKLKKKVKLKAIPRLHYKIDLTESKAAEIDEILEQIKNEK